MTTYIKHIKKMIMPLIFYNIESIIKDLRRTLNKKGIDTKDLHIENLMPKQTL